MKPGLAIGAKERKTLMVNQTMLAKAPASFGGDVIHPVLGTATLVEMLEWLSRQLILPYLESNEEGVGASIEMRHIASVGLGSEITLESTVVEMSERRIKTKVQAFLKEQLIADGSFVQGIIPKASLSYFATASRVAIPKKEVEEPQTNIVSNALRLTSVDGQSSLSIELIEWESLFPCTPYDEWLKCRINLQSPAESRIAEGSLLLRIEVEQICDALLRLHQASDEISRQPFASDFLDPTLNLKLSLDENWQMLLSASLNTSERVTFLIDKATIEPWCLAMRQRLLQLLAQL